MQIPGKQLFALVKRYLRVTSLLEEQGGEQPESSRLKQEFEFSMAMAGLIVELLRAMGWEHSHEPEPTARQETKPQTPRSIFQHGAASCSAARAAPAPPPKEPSAFKTRSAFPSRSSYVEYVRAQLVPGMRVRLLEDYEQVSAGDEGEFRQSNDGTPPVQVPAAARMGLAILAPLWSLVFHSLAHLCVGLSSAGVLASAGLHLLGSLAHGGDHRLPGAGGAGGPAAGHEADKQPQTGSR